MTVHNLSVVQEIIADVQWAEQGPPDISIVNTLRTGDADLRLYITAVQDGWRKSAFLTRAWFPRAIHLITQ